MASTDYQVDFSGGMDGRKEPGLLAPTQFASMRNGELEGGKPRTRRGCLFHRSLPGAGAVRGSCVFTDQDTGLQRGVVAVNRTGGGLAFHVWSEHSVTVEILDAPEEDAREGEVNFCQAGGFLYVFRGEGFTPWRWDGKGAFEKVETRRWSVIANSYWTGGSVYVSTEKAVCWRKGDVVRNFVGAMLDWDKLTDKRKKEFGSQAKYEAWRDEREVKEWSELTDEERGFWETAEAYNARMTERKAATANVNKVISPTEFLLDGLDDDEELWVVGDPLEVTTAEMDKLPSSGRAEYAGNRLWVATGWAELYASDILDVETFDYAKASFQVNSGDGGRIARTLGYQDSSILVFKDNAVYVVENIYASVGSQTVKMLTPDGCAAAGSVCQAGDEVLFLSRRGVLGLRQTESQRSQAIVAALSDPVKPLLDAANWGYADKMRAVVFGNYYILALPMDGQTTNRSALVYDLALRCWLGRWDFQTGVKEWAVLRRAGRDCLFFVGEDCEVYRMFADEYRDAGEPLAFELMSRSFAPGAPLGGKVTRKGFAGLWSRGAAFGVDLTSRKRPFEGQAGVVGRTPNYVKFTTAGKGDFVEDNRNGDQRTPGREDYAPVVVPAEGLLVPAEGVGVDAAQYWEETFNAPDYGNGFQLTVRATGGTVKVDALAIMADDTIRAK